MIEIALLRQVWYDCINVRHICRRVGTQIFAAILSIICNVRFFFYSTVVNADRHLHPIILDKLKSC